MSEQTHKQAVQQQFAATAAAYVSSTVHANPVDLERMIALGELRGDERVLDIATGGGHTARAFAPHVQEVVATDLTPAMLQAAQDHLTAQGITNVRFEVADAEALPYPAASFDVVTCRVAPHHFGDVARFVREAARVLRSGGRFVLDDTIAPEDEALDTFINLIEQLRDPTHARDYTVREWRAFCDNAKLTVDHVETFTKTIPFADWCTRSHTPAQVQAELNQRLRDAPPAARAAFKIEMAGDQVQQFVLHSVLLRARKA